MFLVKKGTIILIEYPKSERWFHFYGWRSYNTTEDRIYDTSEVWDAVAVANEREDVPLWACRNIEEHNKVVLCRKGRYALVNQKDVTYLD